MKATEQYFPVVLFIVLYKVVLRQYFPNVCFAVFYKIKFRIFPEFSFCVVMGIKETHLKGIFAA